MRSSRVNFGGKGIVALEEEAERQEELEEGDGEVAPVEDNANSLETDLIEAGDDHAEVQEITEAVDDGIETVEALESLRIVVHNAGAAGGLDQHGASAVRVALESLYARVGARVDQPTPALESFGGAADKARATIALEADIKARAQAIFEKIKEAVKKAIAWVVELFNKMFRHAEKLESRAKSLADQAGRLTGVPSEK
ncbi:hypothetical protein PQR34_42235, partial [Paraburkholderia sediminicola]|uniref:hypothetical protein n=1 Tax=Paraburkholderia sediminicola TaxID=458836 RepID=UPI0038BA839C